jgi:hypothetical protein
MTFLNMHRVGVLALGLSLAVLVVGCGDLIGTVDGAHLVDAGPGDVAHKKDGNACPGDGSDCASSDAAVDACSAIAAAICAAEARCEPFNGISAEYGTMSSCLERQVLSCNLSLRTPAQNLACATARMNEPCVEWSADEFGPPVCYPMPGKGETGEPCTVNQQCASAFCATVSNAACGTCQPTPIVGTACPLGTCGSSGLACYKSVCVHDGTLGTPCNSTQPCSTGLSCLEDTDGGLAGTCQPNANAVGATCSAHVSSTGVQMAPDCDSLLGFFCATPANLDQCRLSTLVIAGQPCGSIDSIDYVCSDESTCEPVPITTDGGPSKACIRRAGDGAPCDTATGPACIPPSRCIMPLTDGGATAGICTAVDPRTTTCP